MFTVSFDFYTVKPYNDMVKDETELSCMKYKHQYTFGDQISLDLLSKGMKVKVVEIRTPDHVFKRRLMDMGITEGVQIKIKKIAPLGDPVDIELRGYELCLRKKDLAMIDGEIIK